MQPAQLDGQEAALYNRLGPHNLLVTGFKPYPSRKLVQLPRSLINKTRSEMSLPKNGNRQKLEPKIRQPKPEDASDIARIRVTSWLEAYGHILPARILGQQSIERDRKRLKASISKPPLDRKMLIAEIGKRLVGFVTFERNPASNDNSVEIRALYVDKSFHRKGIGTALFNSACSGFPTTSEILRIGCLEENLPARQFYRSLGGKELETRRPFTIDGFQAPEAVYEWNLKHLRERSDN